MKNNHSYGYLTIENARDEYGDCDRCGGNGIIDGNFKQIKEILNEYFCPRNSQKEAKLVIKFWREWKKSKLINKIGSIVCPECGGDGLSAAAKQALAEDDLSFRRQAADEYFRS